MSSRPDAWPAARLHYTSTVLRVVVDSSSLRSIGYDAAALTLEVEFRNGSVYRYANVPSELWGRFRRAESVGKFFQDHVRDQFETTRVA